MFKNFTDQLQRRNGSFPEDAPMSPQQNPHKHRMSRRSISKHTQEPGTGLSMLKDILAPEVEVVMPEKKEEEQVDVSKIDIDSNDKELKLEDCLKQIKIHFDTDDILDEKEYIEKIDTFTSFHEVLQDSRASIKPLREYLIKFEENLSKLSKEMEFLQQKSNSLNDEIADKKILDQKLTPIINDLVIPPEVVRSILGEDVNAKWCENLRFLSEKQEIYLKYMKGDMASQSIKELQIVLDNLVKKATERIRDFIIRKIKMLRVNGVPSQVVQQQLLDVAEIYAFLLMHHKDLALELRQAYVYTMRWYYHSFFAKYLYSLEKLNLHQVGKHVLLSSTNEESIQETSTTRSGFGSLFGSASPAANSRRGTPANGGPVNGSGNGAGATPSIDRSVMVNEYLNLGDRGAIITADDPTVILAQIAENNQLTYWMEFGFRNFNVALLDNVCVEYLFLNEFFCIRNDSKSNVNELCEVIFRTTFSLGINYTKNLIANTYDSYGILICIRLSQALEYELQHRRIPVMEDYLNLQIITLWPKFQKIVDANCENMKKALTRASAIPSTTLFGGSTAKKADNSLIPTLLTQQYAKYLSGLLNLTTHSVFETEQVEPLSNSIQRLTNDFENVLNKLNTIWNKNDAEKKELFLYNNYYLIYTTLTTMGSKLAVQEREHFKMLIDAYQPK